MEDVNSKASHRKARTKKLMYSRRGRPGGFSRGRGAHAGKERVARAVPAAQSTAEDRRTARNVFGVSSGVSLAEMLRSGHSLAEGAASARGVPLSAALQDAMYDSHGRDAEQAESLSWEELNAVDIRTWLAGDHEFDWLFACDEKESRPVSASLSAPSASVESEPGHSSLPMDSTGDSELDALLNLDL